METPSVFNILKATTKAAETLNVYGTNEAQDAQKYSNPKNNVSALTASLLDFSKKSSKLGYPSYDSVFSENIAYDGGLRYAPEDAKSIAKSAVKFAEADIKLIEQRYADAKEDTRKDGKLDMFEIMNFYNEYSYYYSQDKYHEDFCNMNIDKDPLSVSAKEYAAYLLAIDSFTYNESLDKYIYDPNSADGLITREEMEYAMSLDDETLNKYAGQAYSKNYSRLFG